MTSPNPDLPALLPVAPSPDAGARIFLIPYSGCGASAYRRWPTARNGVEYCRLQPPGREKRIREPSFLTYVQLAEEICQVLAPYLDRPYSFFGHCGSALAAYEASVHLQRSGLRAPACLFVSSQVAPQDGPAGRFLAMTDAELLEELAEMTKAMGGTPVPALLQLYVDILRSDLEANKRYIVPDPVRLRCPITAIAWSECADLPAARMSGWSRCGRTENVLLRGGHHRFLDGGSDLLDVLEEGVLPLSCRRPPRTS
jgi:surfactin synthase thioesterase subunit